MLSLEAMFQQAKLGAVAADLKQVPKDGRIHVVIAGKSNAGKSSLINKLCFQKSLARTSSTAGKTRQLIFFDVCQNFYLTDLPGYGFSKSPKAEQEAFAQLTDRYLRSEQPIALILHIIDSRHAPSALDLMMISWLEANNYPYLLLLNKSDKMSRAQGERAKKEIKEAIKKAGCPMPEMLSISAQNGMNVDRLREIIFAAVNDYVPVEKAPEEV